MPQMRMRYRDVDRLPFLNGLYRTAKARGLDLEISRHKQVGSEDWGEALRRGDIDALAENYWGLQRYRAQGVPLVTVASAAHTWVELLLARPGIKTLQDLRGKKLAVRLTGPQRSFPLALLASVKLDDDIGTVVYAESDTGRWGHWKKVVDGSCDACFMLPSYADGAKAAGLIEVPYGSYAFDGAHIIPTTTESFIARNRDAVELLVEAMFDTCARINSDPAWFRELTIESLEALREHFPLEDDAAVDRFCAVQLPEIAALPIPTPQGLTHAYDVAVLQYPEITGFNPMLMWDLSFARASYARRFGSTDDTPATIAAPPGDTRQ
jgi:ABC-type nitrate/sulfonate/bicarbonate transport system substrate-binding protein